MDHLISTKLERFGFLNYKYYIKQALESVRNDSDVIVSVIAQIHNNKNKKRNAVFILTSYSLVYSMSGLTPTTTTIDIEKINHVSIKTKLNGTHVFVDTLWGFVDIIFTNAKTATKFIQEVNNTMLGSGNISTTPTPISNLSIIKELKELLDADAITQDEFDTKKKELLNL